jgi:hypothetical protein
MPWKNHTLVSLNDRKRLLESLVSERQQTDTIFDMVYRLLPTDHMSTSGTHRPMFIPINDSIKITRKEMFDFYHFLFETALSLLEFNTSRWIKMIDYIGNMDSLKFDIFIDRMNKIDWRSADLELKKIFI